MLDSYIECALWSSTDDDGAPMDRRYDASDLAPEARKSMRADVDAFAADNADDLAVMTAEQAGHDFWLTRNHHGAGFWDRGLGELGERLTQAAHACAESYLSVGDDGLVYAA